MPCFPTRLGKHTREPIQLRGSLIAGAGVQCIGIAWKCLCNLLLTLVHFTLGNKKMVWLCFLKIIAFASASTVIDGFSFDSENVITRDVVIVSGGASGTYAAVRLREILVTSIIVIEEKDRLVRPRIAQSYQDIDSFSS